MDAPEKAFEKAAKKMADSQKAYINAHMEVMKNEQARVMAQAKMTNSMAQVAIDPSKIGVYTQAVQKYSQLTAKIGMLRAKEVKSEVDFQKSVKDFQKAADAFQKAKKKK